ncbi:ubiquitin carboxyl-terminal hydrolase 4-like isoform X2 [Brienomyrus brachyistius]|uniref:ubiquitin carboxyl-terminal hydrolase 4-like isoform X2 n=1 Tax=Brienomyrus brachyistius TaxID=42636 RepID=UPI0020B3117D|nr:ubiquitin carboxyl-terminal hydrolase 4-like isoform X2 [Brienomyrus brachyistius]
MAEGGGPELGGGLRPDPEPEPEPAPPHMAMPSAEHQKQTIGVLIKTPLRKGDDWFLIDTRWFKQWKKYVGYESWDMYNVGERNLFPGPIDNSGLFSDHEAQSLKEHLIDELDYILLPTEAWQKLVSWYGFLEGQRPIVRKVVEHGMFVKHCKVEVYLLELNLCEFNNMDKVVTRHFSKADTVGTIEKEMRKLFGIPMEKETRLWNKYMSNTFEQLNKMDGTVQDSGLFQGQMLVIEQKNEDGAWSRQSQHAKSSTTLSPSFTTSSALSSNSWVSLTMTNGDSSISGYAMNSSASSDNRIGGYSSYSSSYIYSEAQTQPGLCGLSNLGNTCFMNSALQCLSHASPLTEYFLNDHYEAEINRENPLGMRGEIAEAYADLIKQMWLNCNCSYMAPRTFKTQVGRFAPQFSGYQQQDSQELLAFLLDGLHEDLNRVKKKPYLELRDADGRPDETVAAEAWRNHRLRNDSIIVDIFHALFKSTLVCPECSKISVTFDPFCYLTLPLPMKKDRTMEVSLVRTDPQSRLMQYRVVVPKLGTVVDLCNALSKLSGIATENMLVADVYNHRFHKIYRREDSLNNIMDKDDIFVYEVEVDDENGLNLLVYFRERQTKSAGGSPGALLFGQPLLITVPRQNLTVDLLYTKVFDRIRRYVKWPQESVTEGKECSSAAVYGSCHDAEDHMVHGCNTDSQGVDPLAEAMPCGSEPNSKQQSGICSGSSKVCEEEEAMDHQVSPEPEYSASEASVCDEEDEDEDEEGELSTVAMDWDSEMKKLYYDDQEAEAYEKHESMLHLQKKKVTVALKECIELFTTMETLGEHDPWYCPTCKKHQRATKKFDLWSLPRILVVHLKRFSYNRCWRDKLDTVVDFPIRNLNMSEFVCNPKAGRHVYDLFAVSNHYGGLGGGHYTAFAKNNVDEKWYYFDDSSVSSATEDQIVTKAAYVLFYQRRDGDSPTIASTSLTTQDTETGDDNMDTN